MPKHLMYEEMEHPIIISNINDFMFCPASIYFHNLYGNQDKLTYQSECQMKGSIAHTTVDNGTYSTRKDILLGIEVYSELYKLTGKIDIYYGSDRTLVERKRKINTVFDGYIFQLYAQYFGMVEAGYEISKLCLYSMEDNKKYSINLPCDDAEMLGKFEKTLSNMQTFDLSNFQQTNAEKCRNCIYEPACDRSLVC